MGLMRWLSLAMALGGAVAFVVLAALLVPWHPYPGGALHPPAAGSIFTHDQIARASAYSHVARWLGRSALLVSLVVACLLGFTRFGRVVTARLRGPWWLRAIVLVVIVGVIGQLATLPLEIALQHQQLRYGLSRQGWASYLSNVGISTGVTVVATAIAVVVLLATARRWRRVWPVIAGVVIAALVLLGSFVYPVVVEPLFSNFTSLPQGDLRTQIMQIAQQEHVHLSDVLVTDASHRTTELNAYVTGFGSTRRVVLYDNLIDKLPRGQVLSVVAHELGHAHHDDVLTGTLLGVAAAFLGVGLLGLLVGRRYGGLRDPAVVPLLLALFALGSFVALPVENTISRQIETRADVAALVTTQDETSFVDLQRQLAVSSLADPTPPAWSQFWFGSHPTALQRIAVAERVLGGK